MRWSQGAITYSDPDRRSDYQADHPEFFTDLAQLDAAQLRVAHATLNSEILTQAPGHAGLSAEGVTGLKIDYAGRGTGGATIRLVNSSDPGTAYAYYPSRDVYGGDVFLGYSGSVPVVGNYHHQTIIHEIGHALGLKHGHETTEYGAVPRALDSMEYSVMTYRSFVGARLDGYRNEAFGFAQTLMMLDIAALQDLYGADYVTTAGDTVYAWDSTDGRTLIDGKVALAPGANRIFMTVWDGGGVDTYDLSDYGADLDIDLAPGGRSTFSTTQLAYLGGGPNGGDANGNVYNALLHRGDTRSLIENAVGGSGSDTIRGNSTDNLLTGDAGNDALYGRDGDDTLFGGPGRDLLDGGAGSDTILFTSMPRAGTIDLGAGFADFPTTTSLNERLVSIENAVGGAGGDALLGSATANRLDGGAGADTMVGRGGADILVGGMGDDVFRYLAVSDSAPGRRDRIEASGAGPAFFNPGAAPGDRIDLSAIDANLSRAGNQAFEFGAAKGIGRLWLAEADDDTLVRGDVNARSGFELEIVIADVGVRAEAYSGTDFLL